MRNDIVSAAQMIPLFKSDLKEKLNEVKFMMLDPDLKGSPCVPIRPQQTRQRSFLDCQESYTPWIAFDMDILAHYLFLLDGTQCE